MEILRKGNNVGEMICSEVDLNYFRVSSPVFSGLAWEIESFLVRHFEYGNYSFRSTLRGFYGEGLSNVFYICRSEGRIVGAAGGLYSRSQSPGFCGNTKFGVLGPVCVDSDYRRRGIGSEIVSRLLGHFYSQGCRSIYLGTSGGSGVKEFYERQGFSSYSGIVMRRHLFSEAEFLASFAGGGGVRIRRMGWEDFCGVSVLLVEPVEIVSFDFKEGIFSTRYFVAERFLGVFPSMMERFARYGGFGNVLLSVHSGTVVGVCHIKRFISGTQRHLAVLDFFVHDNFIERSRELVEKTLVEAGELSVKELICFCPAVDKLKEGILLSVGFKRGERLERFLRLGEKRIPVDIYRYKVSSRHQLRGGKYEVNRGA